MLAASPINKRTVQSKIFITDSKDQIGNILFRPEYQHTQHGKYVLCDIRIT